MHTSDIVWQPNELSEKEIDKWLQNFSGAAIRNESEERILALWLLNHFVFYNENEIRHLCKLVYRDFVHTQLLARSPFSNIEKEISDISSLYKFHYMGKPSESGAYILYYFRQENALPMKYFLKHLDTNTEIDESVIFIDDNTLTGDESSQAYDFFSSLTPKDTQRTLLTFIATSEAISNLKDLKVDVISAIVLDGRDKCFDSNSEVFIHHKAHLVKCKEMATYYGSQIAPSKKLGYRDAQLMYGFFYNTPDNTLPIFWSTKNGWHPIVKRYDKKQNVHFTEDERFV